MDSEDQKSLNGSDSKIFDEPLGRAISMARCSLDLSVEVLAIQSEMTQERLAKIEKGEESVTILELVEIAKALNSKPSALVSVADKLQSKWQPEETN